MMTPNATQIAIAPCFSTIDAVSGTTMPNESTYPIILLMGAPYNRHIKTARIGK